MTVDIDYTVYTLHINIYPKRWKIHHSPYLRIIIVWDDSECVKFNTTFCTKLFYRMSEYPLEDNILKMCIIHTRFWIRKRIKTVCAKDAQLNVKYEITMLSLTLAKISFPMLHCRQNVEKNGRALLVSSRIL